MSVVPSQRASARSTNRLRTSTTSVVEASPPRSNVRMPEHLRQTRWWSKSAEGRHKYDQASGLALLLDTRPSSAVTFSLLYMGLLHGFVPSPRPRPVRRSTPVRQGHRNHGAPPSGACSEPTASRTCPVQSSRSSDPRCIQPAPPSKSVEVLHRSEEHT